MKCRLLVRLEIELVSTHHLPVILCDRLRAAVALMLVAAALSACMGPQVMIATNVASAALKASVDYAEKNKPTPAQAWRASRRQYLEEQGHAGNASSQYAVAQLYQGHRDGAAQFWMCKAANSGHPAAQLQLGHWYNEDRLTEDPWPFISVRPDDRVAYMWYSLAELNGERSGEPFRLQLKNDQLNDADLEAAEAMTAGWAPGSCGVLASADPEVKD